MVAPIKRKKMTLSRAGSKAKTIATKASAIAKAPIITTKQQLMTVENLATPVHILVSGYQAEAILTLVELMRESKNDATRQKSASEILSLGGNSSEMLKIQAIQSGRHKDISQMSRTEIEAFVVEARRKLTVMGEIMAHNAENVTPSEDSDSAGCTTVDGEVAPWDSAQASDTEDYGL